MTITSIFMAHNYSFILDNYIPPEEVNTLTYLVVSMK